eukprot:gene20495-27286_t
MQLARSSNVRTARDSSTRARRPLVAVAAFGTDVRPYTLRKGDTVETIAHKRNITVKELMGINPDLNPDKCAEGKTILLPSGNLSVRDREILSGIGPGYRVYPVRSGENLEDIMSKRKITMDEMEALNPGVNLKAVRANALLKLPSNKFTVREREMLIGSGILPAEFFAAAKNPFVIGFGVLLMVCGFVLAWQQFYKDEDEYPPEELA